MQEMPDGSRVTTRLLADYLACSEYQVRGAMTWLAAGGIVEHDGYITRTAADGQRYTAKAYRLTHRRLILRVPRDKDLRRAALEEQASSLVSRLLTIRW